MTTPTPATGHTKLPCKISSANEVFGDGQGGEAFSEWLNIVDADGEVVCEFPGHSQFARGKLVTRIEDERAAFIVEACNNYASLRESHARLLEALKIAFEFIDHATYAPVEGARESGIIEGTNLFEIGPVSYEQLEQSRAAIASAQLAAPKP